MKKLFILLLALALSASAACAAVQTPPALTGTTTAAAVTGPETVPTQAAVPALPEAETEGLLSFTAVNVGKGDALVLTLPDGSTVLVDTGCDDDLPLLARALKSLEVTQLDTVILTHGHSDHMGGLSGVLALFPTERVLCAAADTVSFGKKEPEKSAGSVPVVQVAAGDTLTFGDARMTFLAPLTVDTAEENNNSLVLRVEYGERSLLLMGDAEASVESALLASGTDLTADVLKAGHHGKNDATTPEFFAAAAPRYTVLTGDTGEDADSPGSRVLALASSESEAIVTDGDWLTWTYTTDGHSERTAYAGSRQQLTAEGPVLESPDRKAESVTVTNPTAESYDLTGCWLYSEGGGEAFRFPDGTVLAPGASLTVVSGKKAPAGDLIWSESSVWKKKNDDALLFDAEGRLLCRVS